MEHPAEPTTKDALLQAKVEDFRRFGQKEHELWLACGKALMVLNSAGVAAMLAFMQALVSKGPLTAFKPYGVASMLVYLVGVGAGFYVLRRRMQFSFYMARDLPQAREFGDRAEVTLKTGVILFAMASVISVLGVALTL
jgi:hypothetical protein